MAELRTLLLALATLATWLVSLYHLAAFPPPPAERLAVRAEVLGQSRFISRREAGLNHLLLFGSPYERGLAAGRLTQDLIRDEEHALVAELERFFPNPLARWALMAGAMRWFWGIDAYLPPWAMDEMFGVAQSASAPFDGLADPFTRQIAYHGVHEVGQMFVDFERQDFGCTLLGVPRQGGWLIGRNFDFEAIRLLDEEKIVKWVFPDRGQAYVSIIWAGMVGAVTGVNDQGVYVSLNAAGTSDFRRLGTPTTLVALEALQEAKTAAEAVRLIERATVFISDLFVVTAPGEGLYVIEKTPQRFRTTRWSMATAVANHLTSPAFREDPVNGFRMREQTTVARLARATELVQTLALDQPQAPEAAARAMAAALRDKQGPGNTPLHLGHRRALDALIATHSVVYDAAAPKLWVSQGPALTGAYLGYDLAASFRDRSPVAIPPLPADPAVDRATFARFHEALRRVATVKAQLKDGRCAGLEEPLAALASSPAKDHYEYLMTLGDYQQTCRGDRERARSAWQGALAATPAYLRHRLDLEGRLR